ncbi:MerR family transcriptional regulator [Aneurinibacillus migulanus]|uniref:Transcriptional regulator n=1 Tax=Aneurinibacillus migulanus TaxID=47500 RepID=A0A0D1VYJ9_ANEMI|nr:MerR family transcriptional regulator [Aneurinibacillus migulanus]KIV51305.1 transcriptional regulator [Aneurinibacillus migulanus]KON94777.1 transcriptional regulator [Aneurinibacillus migulanus]MED0894682.1 MerR family transcriptional regulator [Aneurinibacillus migulanus]MED1615170.1 MerR family transcriptional regulator [Aneurinibacillus migulanus]SDJ11332.1 DNA-binding transcriptional regulator, MerR family [Aneurinibacillus migulanus]
MYSIGEVSKLTGISAFTLRYYEKIGLLPNPQRQDGKRRYDDQDLRFIRFIYGLKHTGMKLEDIATFVEDGCLLVQNEKDIDITDTLRKRIKILEQHIGQLEQQMKQLEVVKAVAKDKRNFYANVLKEQASEAVKDV